MDRKGVVSQPRLWPCKKAVVEGQAWSVAVIWVALDPVLRGQADADEHGDENV